MQYYEIYKSWSGMSAKEYKEFKGIRKESLRDNMTNLEVILTDLGEATTREFAKIHKPYGLKENKQIARMGGHVALVAREDIEKNIGGSVISEDNALGYKYGENKQIESE